MIGDDVEIDVLGAQRAGFQVIYLKLYYFMFESNLNQYYIFLGLFGTNWQIQTG